MARFLSEHPDPFGWNPLQYRGLPTHDWYLPVMPYAGALAIKLAPGFKPEHAYRLLAVTLATLGPVTLFLFLAAFTRSLRWPAITSLAYSLCSVSYLIFPAIQADQGFTYVPWRIQVLVKYGEGPHNAGLMLLPLALWALWRASTGRRVQDLVLAALGLAVVTLTNWVAAIALAWCCLMMLAAGELSRPETGFFSRRLLASAGLAYLLAAFWLTPRYILTTFFNWPTDAFGYKVDNTKYLLATGLLLFPAATLWLFRRRPRDFFLVYLLLCLAGFAWVVSIHYWWRIDIIPESRRYAIEFELFLFAAGGEILRRVVPGPAGRWRDWTLVTAGFLFAFVSAQPVTYLTRTWTMLRPAPRETTIEYQVAARLAALRPEGRLFVPGGSRFRLNSWFGLPQLGGSFESGLRNRGALHIAYQLQKGLDRPLEARATDALHLLRAAGIEYAVLHGARSSEHWRDTLHPELVFQKLEPVWREGSDGVYRVPFRGLANFVTPAELPAGQGAPVGQYTGLLEPYVRSMDATDRPPVRLRWIGPSQIELSVPSTPVGFWISLRVSYDTWWQAEQNGHPVGTAMDTLGNIVLRPLPSSSPSVIRLRYQSSRQQLAGTAVSLAALAASVVAIYRERAKRRRHRLAAPEGA